MPKATLCDCVYIYILSPSPATTIFLFAFMPPYCHTAPNTNQTIFPHQRSPSPEFAKSKEMVNQTVFPILSTKSSRMSKPNVTRDCASGTAQVYWPFLNAELAALPKPPKPNMKCLEKPVPRGWSLVERIKSSHWDIKEYWVLLVSMISLAIKVKAQQCHHSSTKSRPFPTDSLMFTWNGTIKPSKLSRSTWRLWVLCNDGYILEHLPTQIRLHKSIPFWLNTKNPGLPKHSYASISRICLIWPSCDPEPQRSPMSDYCIVLLW